MATPERGERIKELFHAALERATGERPAFLSGACAGDEALRREVESLLAAHRKNSDFLREPALRLSAVGVAAELLDEEDWAAGLRVGAYRLLREIGRGGVGTVYLAVRDDDEYRKRVAVKLLKRGRLGREIVGRFRRERQILADLEHPNIARLIDGGTTEAGLPYFVMEYVEGLPVDRYCDEHALGVEERLRLFREICSAVESAHRKGVVHRDIKPSNVIVTREGVPKLIDFGIAKLSPQAQPAGDSATATAQRAMTPEYASPEQMRGEGVGAASDIYSLGVLLYELLTGRLPYRLGGKSPYEIVRAICEEEPVRPSEAAESTARGRDAGRLRRRLSGDLDNILLQALRKEPARRYGDAGQLSEDIRRHLAGLPVSAHEDTVAYRAGKFLRRNRAAALTTLAVAALCLIVGVALAMLASRARPRNSLAVMPLTNRGGSESAYLADGLTDGLIEELSRVPRLSIPPRRSVSDYRDQGAGPRAVGAALGAGTLLRGSVAAEGERLRVTVEMVDTDSEKVVWAWDYDGTAAEPLALQRRIAGDVTRELGLGDGAVARTRARRGHTDEEAYRLYLQGRYFWNQRTAESLARALEYFTRAAERDTSYALAYTGIADCHALMAAYMIGDSHPHHFRAARAAAQRARELDDGLAEAHTTLGLVAWLHDWDWEAADREFRRAIDLDPRYVTAHHWRGLFLGEMGRFDEAEAEMRRAAELDPVSGAVYADFGRVLYWARRYEDALEMYRKADELGPRAGDYYLNLADLYEQMGLIEDWLALAERFVGPSPRDRAALQKGGFREMWRVRHAYDVPAKVKGHDRAELCARIGLKDEAFKALREAYGDRDHRLSQLRVNPKLDALRSDPRFAELLRRMNL